MQMDSDRALDGTLSHPLHTHSTPAATPTIIPRVFLASTAPPVRFPNVYGINMAPKAEFVANGRTVEQVDVGVGLCEINNVGCGRIVELI